MGRHGVTMEAVLEAIQKLQREGKPPTVDAIRHTIGSGSKSTIIRHLHDLKMKASAETALAPGHTPPPPELLNLVSTLWDKMQSTSDSHSSDALLKEKYIALQLSHETVTRQFQMRLRAFEKLEQKMAQQQQLITAYEHELRQKNVYNQELARRIKMLSNELQQTKISIQKMQQQIASLENTKKALMQEIKIAGEKS